MKKIIETTKGKNLAKSTNKPLSQAELAYELKKAEDGPFISVQEGMKDFEQWLQSRENE